MSVVRTALEFYPSFYHNYIKAIPEGDILELIKESGEDMLELIKNIPDDKWLYRYAEGKWTMAEVLVHMNDSERVFAYRALRMARNDQTVLPGFEQDDYVPNSGANQRTKASVFKEYKLLRASTLALFEGFSPEMWLNKGNANGYDMTSSMKACILLGHELHHKKILRERYLG